MHLLDNWHFTAKLSGQRPHRTRVAYALCDHPGFAADFFDRSTRRNLDPHAAIAAQISRACEDQIAQPRKAGESHRIGAHSNCEARHLREPSSDECGSRIVTEAEAVTDSCGNRDDILDNTAHLNPDDVLRRV